MDRKVIENYGNGAEKLSLAIRGLTREDLLAVPSDPEVGKWSIQQVVNHLVDCEGVFADRMKRVIAEENPNLLAFDEPRWTASLAYEQRSAVDEVAVFELLRKQMATILTSLPDSAFDRAGTHDQRGRMTLAEIVKFASDHLEHHLKFIHAKRAKMGKEMW